MIPPQRKYALPTVDFAFKRIFGNPKNTTCLNSLLEAILNIEVNDLEINNSEILKSSPDEKGLRLDVLASIGNHQRVNIEIQVNNEGNIDKRSLNHAARLVTGQNILGRDYIFLVPVISIFLLDFIWFKDLIDFHHPFVLKNKVSNLPLFQKEEVFEIHLVEIPKSDDSHGAASSRLKKWMTFFKTKNDQVLEELKMIDNVFEHAVSELEYAKMKPEERALYEAQLTFISDQVSGLNHAERVGIEKGKAEGKAEALHILINARFPSFSTDALSRLNTFSAHQINFLLINCLKCNNQEELLNLINQAMVN